MLEESSRSEAGTKEQPAGWVLVNLRIFVGLAGVVACYAWLFLALGTSAFFPDTANGLAMGGGHVLLLLGSCVAFLVIWLLSDWFQARKALQCAVSGVVTILGVAGLWAAHGFGGGGARSLGLVFPDGNGLRVSVPPVR